MTTNVISAVAGGGSGSTPAVGACASVTAGSQSIPDGTSTALTFPVTDYANGVTHSGTQFTVLASGAYLLSAHASFNTNTTGLRSIGYRINGGAPWRMMNEAAVSSAITRTNMAITILLVAGDFVEFVAEQSSGSGLIVATALGSVVKM